MNLGANDDYFDINNATEIVVTRDGRYGFVLGSNTGPFRVNGAGREDVDGVQAGSNIGIIANPLSDQPTLLAATRPIPTGFGTDLVLSEDNKTLYVAQPGLGSVFAFDVDQMLYTLDHFDQFKIDGLDRGIGSRFFDATTARPVEALDLELVSIDDINPDISIAADYGITQEDRVRNQFTYGVLEVPDGQGGWMTSPSAPLGVPVFDLVTTPSRWLGLTELGSTVDTTPTLTWQLQDSQGNAVVADEINLFVSVFSEGQGLLPWDKVVNLDSPNGDEFLASQGLSKQEQIDLLTRKWTSAYHTEQDFNPNRIVTATWKRDPNGAVGGWFWADNSPILTIKRCQI